MIRVGLSSRFPSQADSIVIVGIADGSPAVGQVLKYFYLFLVNNFTYSFVWRSAISFLFF